MQPTQSVLTFEGYRVTESIITYNKSDNQSTNLSTNLNSKVHMDDDGIINSSLMVDINSSDDHLKIHVCIMGDFTLTQMETLTKEQINYFAKQSTISILFPYLRSFISTITLHAGIPPITLPIINVVEALKDESDNEESL